MMRWIAEVGGAEHKRAAGEVPPLPSRPKDAAAMNTAVEIRRPEAMTAAEQVLRSTAVRQPADRDHEAAEDAAAHVQVLELNEALLRPQEPEPSEIAAEVIGLRLKFPGVPDLLFRDLSLSIRQGEKVLLLGPSGCGKSTLLQVLGGVIPRVTEVPLKAERLKVPESAGMVFQDPDTQFCMPYVDEELAFVLENLTVPREEMRPRIEAALREVGLNLPDIHVPIGSLSQGMKQRLALASALLLAPDTLLLDEPSALLDPEGRSAIWAAVRRVSERRTVIVVEHRIDDVLDWMDRVIVFRGDGSLLADDSAAEVFSRYRGKLREYGIWYPGAWDDALCGAAAAPISAGAAPQQERRSEVLSAEAWRLPDRAAAPEIGALEPGAARGGDGLAQREEAASAMCERELRAGRPDRPKAQSEAAPPAAGGAFDEPLLRLEHFRVLRGGREVCAVEQAAVMPGDLIALTGPNGAGKSSLLLGLMGLLPRQGVCQFGAAFPASRREERQTAAKHAAFVFQNPEFQFVTNRVQDEVAFTLRGEAEEAALTAAQAGGASWKRRLTRRVATLSPADRRRRARLAAEMEQEAGRRASACLESFGLGGYEDRHPYLLSLGQKRRLSVASAVVTHKPLLLLDEPTFGQDAQNAFAILRLCEELRAAGHAVLMITHEPEIAERLATQVWRIEEGRLTSAKPTGRSRMDGILLSKGGEAE